MVRIGDISDHPQGAAVQRAGRNIYAIVQMAPLEKWWGKIVWAKLFGQKWLYKSGWVREYDGSCVHY
mgnify:CR=1 FL=1